MMITDMEHIYAGSYAEAGSYQKGDSAEWHPEQNLVVGKVLDDNGEGSCDAMRDALQWVLRLKNRYKIRILNISVGIGELKERYKEQVLREELEIAVGS